MNNFNPMTLDDAKSNGIMPVHYGQMAYEILSVTPSDDMFLVSIKINASENIFKEVQFSLSLNDAQSNDGMIRAIENEIKKYRAELIVKEMVGNKGLS